MNFNANVCWLLTVPSVQKPKRYLILINFASWNLLLINVHLCIQRLVYGVCHGTDHSLWHYCVDCRCLKYANPLLNNYYHNKESRDRLTVEIYDMQQQNVMRKLRTFQFGWFFFFGCYRNFVHFIKYTLYSL